MSVQLWKRSGSMLNFWAWIGLLVAEGVLAWIYRGHPGARTAITVAELLVPWATLVLVPLTHGWMSVGAKRNDPRLAAEGGFFIPAIFAFVAGLIAWPLANWSQAVPAWAAISLLTLGIFTAVVGLSQKCTFGTYLNLVLFAAIYGCALTRYLNCGLDASVGAPSAARVTEHHMATGGRGGPTYHINLVPFPGFAFGTSVQVGPTFYYGHPVGSTVQVVLYPGKLGIPWYQLR